MLPDTKKCSTCKEVKPLDSFNRNASQKDGKSIQCKECRRACDAKYREKNKDRVAERKRIYYEKNKDREAEKRRIYYEKNGEYYREQTLETYHSRQESSRAMASKSGAYSPSEDQFIILNDKTMTAYQMAIALGRTFNSTRGRKTRLKKEGLL